MREKGPLRRNPSVWTQNPCKCGWNQEAQSKMKGGLSLAKEEKTPRTHFRNSTSKLHLNKSLSNGLCIFKKVLNEKGPFSDLYLLRMQRLGSRKPIQHTKFKKWSKVGLCCVFLFTHFGTVKTSWKISQSQNEWTIKIRRDPLLTTFWTWCFELAS